MNILNCVLEKFNSTPQKKFVMEMDLDLVINRINFKFLVKMIETGSF
jgi:hypothetical protein